MASGLKTLQHLLRAAAVAALAAVASLAGAQALIDPTRPPAAMEPTPASAGAGNAAGIAASGFQAVILRQGHKPVAVINGVMVELGGKLNDATLVKLSESEAVLQGPSGKEVLQLTPAAEKLSNVKRKPAKGADKATQQPKPNPAPADHD